MTGAEFVASIATSATVFDLRVGDTIGAFDSRLRFHYVEQVHGRKGSRSLRRDYGLFEATFVDGPSWRCTNLIIEVNRLAATEGIIEEIQALERIALPKYIPWSAVSTALSDLGEGFEARQLEQEGDFVRYGFAESRAVIHVLDDGSKRGNQPGAGDVWSVSLTGVA